MNAVFSTRTARLSHRSQVLIELRRRENANDFYSTLPNREMANSDAKKPSNRDQYKVAKIIMVGDSNVGKTSIVERFSSDTFAPSYIPTIGIDFIVQELIIDDAQYVKLHVWDTAGSEKFDAITRNYYHVANAAMIAYDLTDRKSFEHVTNWMKKLEDNCQPGTPMMLLGNKCDLQEIRLVQFAEGNQIASDYGIPFFETSAKTNQNIYKAFFKLTKIILKTQSPEKLKPGYKDDDEKPKCKC